MFFPKFLPNSSGIKLLLKILFISTIITGCSCKTSFMSEVQIAKENDTYLNCEELVYEMSEAQYLLKNAKERAAMPYIFAQPLICAPQVKLDADRKEFLINDRLGYLKQLYTLKKCSSNSMKKNNDILIEKGAKTEAYLPIN